MTIKEAIKYLKLFADDCTLRAYEGEVSGVVIEKDGTGHGQGLEIYNRGSDVGLGVYNEGPPHDHNQHLGGKVYIEDMHPNMLLGDDREVMVAVFETCSYHLGKDCSCKSGFTVTPRLFGGRMLVDMYGLLRGLPSEDDFYFH